MNVTESGFKNRQLHMEDYLQMVSSEQKEYAEAFDYSKIAEKSGVITGYWMNNLLELILRKDNLNKAYKSHTIKDGRGILLTHKYLNAGVIANGMFECTEIGVP